MGCCYIILRQCVALMLLQHAQRAIMKSWYGMSDEYCSDQYYEKCRIYSGML